MSEQITAWVADLTGVSKVAGTLFENGQLVVRHESQHYLSEHYYYAKGYPTFYRNRQDAIAYGRKLVREHADGLEEQLLKLRKVEAELS